jgi:thiamine pyrophosphate-dependent acetolactate synthase large subunit-like protein
MGGGDAGSANRDYVSYLGDPDMDFAILASVYGIKGEVVSNSDQVRPAIERGFRTLADGRPYIIDARTASWGTGAGLTQYQKFSVADLRSRKV